MRFISKRLLWGIFEDVSLMVATQTALRNAQQVELPPESIYAMVAAPQPVTQSNTPPRPKYKGETN